MPSPLLPLLQNAEIRALALGVDNVLLRLPVRPAAGPNTRSNLLTRSTVISGGDPLFQTLLGHRSSRIEHALSVLLSHDLQDLQDTPPEASHHLSQKLYDGFTGSEEVLETLSRLKEGGIGLAVWDNVPGPASAQARNLLEQHYSGLIPPEGFFFSGERHRLIGDEGFLKALTDHLRLSKEEILFVTSNLGSCSYFLQRGIKSLYFRLFTGESATPFSLSLARYLGEREDGAEPQGSVGDPVLFFQGICRLRDVQGGAILPPQLTLSDQEKKNKAFIADQILAFSGSRRLEAILRSLFIDQILWRGYAGAPPLADKVSPEASVPRFLSLDETRREILDMVKEHLEQIERGIPSLAWNSMRNLLEELESLYHLEENFLLQTGIVVDVGSRIRQHIQDNHDLYVLRAKVLHQDEWSTLVKVFHEDDSTLDLRYQEWVNVTYQHERQMAAGGVLAEDIRKFVKERLVDDLILRVMELEMRDRSLQKGIQRVVLFPNLHDTRNRITALTRGIDDRKFWKAIMIEQTATLDRWVRSLVARMKHMARHEGVKLTFRFETEAGLPPMDLSDLLEANREALDHILTELIINAIKYRKRPPEEAQVEVQMIEEEKRIQIVVKDDGVGIQDLEGVWKMGVREHPELAEGSGGGLASVREHVTRQGWQIDLESSPGVGSTFTLTIPRRPSTIPPK